MVVVSDDRATETRKANVLYQGDGRWGEKKRSTVARVGNRCALFASLLTVVAAAVHIFQFRSTRLS